MGARVQEELVELFMTLILKEIILSFYYIIFKLLIIIFLQQKEILVLNYLETTNIFENV